MRSMEATMAEQQLRYLEALYAIVCQSEEPDMIRLALVALTGTPAGLEFLEMNPITV